MTRKRISRRRWFRRTYRVEPRGQSQFVVFCRRWFVTFVLCDRTQWTEPLHDNAGDRFSSIANALEAIKRCIRVRGVELAHEWALERGATAHARANPVVVVPPFPKAKP